MRCILFLIFILNFSCKSSITSELVVLDYISIIDQRFEKDIHSITDTFAIKIVDHNKTRLFIIPFHNQRKSSTLLQNGNIERSNITYDTTFVYCVIEKGKSFGLRYDSLSALIPKKFPVDSLMNRINLGKEHINSNSVTKGKLDFAKRSDKTGEIILEKYVDKGNEIDSTYRYFDSSMKKLDFSISPSLDKKYQSKLVRLVMIHKSLDAEVKDVFIVEIKKGMLSEYAAVLNLIKRFENDIKLGLNK